MAEYRILQEVDSNGYEVPSVAIFNDDKQVVEHWVEDLDSAVEYIENTGGVLAIDVVGNGLEEDE